MLTGASQKPKAERGERGLCASTAVDQAVCSKQHGKVLFQDASLRAIINYVLTAILSTPL